jgi:hypothetical protein
MALSGVKLGDTSHYPEGSCDCLGHRSSQRDETESTEIPIPTEAKHGTSVESGLAARGQAG